LRERRRDLIIKILDKIDWSQLSVFQDVDHSVLIAYGKMTSRDWEELVTENKTFDLTITKHLNRLVCCVLLSAVNGIPTNSDVGPSPFELVQKWASKSESRLLDFYVPLLTLITSMSREELSVLAKIKNKDPALLSDLPCWWEILFTPEHGIAYTKREETMAILKETDAMQEIVKDIFILNQRSICSSPSATEALQLLIKFFQVEEFPLVRKVLQKQDVLWAFADGATYIWLKDVDIAKEYVEKIVWIYIELFGSDWDSWIDTLTKRIPVQLLVVGEELCKKSKHVWSDLVRQVQKRVRYHFSDYSWFSLLNVQHFRYNRECDWYRFFLEIPRLREKVPSDFKERTHVYLTWPCSLLRVWIQVCSEEVNYEIKSFWEMAANEINDGELLHIAVELQSLVVVKSTAWPGFLNWTQKGRTALEFSEEIWGKDHEITKYLQTVTDNLVASGFLPNTKDHVTMSQGQGVVGPARSSSSRLILKRKREPSPACSQSNDTNNKYTYN